VIDGGADGDIIDGNVGSDTISYASRSAAVTVTLAGGADDGEAGENDSLFNVENAVGGSGSDQLTGDADTNVLRGGNGGDTLNGGLGLNTDTLDGGAGTDTASYAGRTEALTLSLDATANDGGMAENDTLTLIENLIGGDGDDTISGDPLVNDLMGGLGVDTITSRDNVADTVSCGGGTDATVIADLSDVVSVDCESVNPGPVPALAIGDVSKAEGNSGTSNAVLTVTATPVPTVPVTVDYATADGTASQPADYTTTTGTLTFAAGEASKTISVPVAGDTSVEADETLTVTLSNAAKATLPARPATVTITNDDVAPVVQPVVPAISIGDATVTEGNSATVAAAFAVTLDKATTVPVTVNVASANNTAKTPDDYAPTSGALTFAPGETTKSVTVLVKGDIVDEADETFGVLLSGPTNATLASKSVGVGTILDDDAPAIPARVRPKLGAKVTPTRDRRAPFTYTVSGKLVLPSGTTAATACTAGTVTVTFKVGSKTVKTAKGALSSTCTYRIRATFKSAKDVKAVKGKKKFTARARFGGNTRLLPAAQTFTLRAG
jgi:hypothetical protein